MSRSCRGLKDVLRQVLQNKRGLRGPTCLESRRRVNPEEHLFLARWIVPTVADCALEPKAVALIQRVAVKFIEPEFKRAGDHVDELLALVRIRSVAAGARLHAKELAF